MEALHRLIHDVPDFPRKGIVYKDITPLLADAAGLALAVELMANPFRGKGRGSGLPHGPVDLVVGAESRGFIFGIAVAQALSAGFVPARKPGKLPRKASSVEYDLEYGKDRLELHEDALRPGLRALIVDDLVATGGTLTACVELVRRSGAELVGASVLIELVALKGRESCGLGSALHSVLKY